MRIALLVAALLCPSIATAEDTSPPPHVRFGIQTPNQNTTWDDLLATWKEAESLGFDSAWVFDHFAPIFGDKDGPCLEG
jgi:alkanesulfonate monooxygenase SsuD/methylene tetrahydromethanopterin reductase-like flavin-dependent oxidoreductase (luciferase family)